MRTHTSPSIVKLAAVGAVAGLVSGLVKFRWENILPPRTPERDATNPPQTFLQQHGLTPAETHATYTYSGHQIPWVSLLVHFGFSSSLGALYAVAGHYVPLFKLGYGSMWGLGVWAGAHLWAMPALKIVQPQKISQLKNICPKLWDTWCGIPSTKSLSATCCGKTRLVFCRC